MSSKEQKKYNRIHCNETLFDFIYLPDPQSCKRENIIGNSSPISVRGALPGLTLITGKPIPALRAATNSASASLTNIILLGSTPKSFAILM